MIRISTILSCNRSTCHPPCVFQSFPRNSEYYFFYSFQKWIIYQKSKGNASKIILCRHSVHLACFELHRAFSTHLKVLFPEFLFVCRMNHLSCQKSKGMFQHKRIGINLLGETTGSPSRRYPRVSFVPYAIK